MTSERRKEKPEATLIGHTIIYRHKFSLHHCISKLKSEQAIERSLKGEDVDNPRGRAGNMLHHIPKIAYMHYLLADANTRSPKSGEIKDIVEVFKNQGYKISPKTVYKWRDEPRFLDMFYELLQSRMFSPEARASAFSTILTKAHSGSVPALKMYMDMLGDYDKGIPPAEKSLNEMSKAADDFNRKKQGELHRVGKPEEVAS